MTRNGANVKLYRAIRGFYNAGQHLSFHMTFSELILKIVPLYLIVILGMAVSP